MDNQNDNDENSWTNHELHRLQELADALPAQVIGLKLGRTTASVTAMADALGLHVSDVHTH
jgi:hypothetical protein